MAPRAIVSGRTLLARAALFRALARGFCYPEPGQVAVVKTLFDGLDRAALGDLDSAALRRALGEARQAWSDADEAVLRESWGRLFLGNIAVQPRETGYGDARRLAGREHELADLNGFYTAFGFTLAADDPDLPDHLAVELEFLSLLLVKEAWALAQREGEAATITGDALRAFLEAHPGRWVESFVRELEAHHAPTVLRAHGALAVAAIATECRLRHAHPEPSERSACNDPLQEEAFVCPMAGA